MSPYISNIIGDMMKSIFDGNLYPTSLQSRCINKLTKEVYHFGGKAINPIRVAILKAYMNRKNRLLYKSNKIISMALDNQETNPGYLLGRLFAIFEKIQEEANYDCRINITITDRFFATALVSPLKIFKELLKLKNQHIKKIKQRNIGRAINLERMIGDVMSNFEAKGIPINLRIDDQSYFIVGYYHQRKELYSKKQIN